MKSLLTALLALVMSTSLSACDETLGTAMNTGGGQGAQGQGAQGQGPAVEDPAVEDPAVEDPAVEDPAVEDPAVEDPAVEDPAVEDPAVEGGQSLDLVFVREEEKLARDVYLHLAEVWGIQTFSNIARSEQSHMDAILGLLQAAGVPDPAEGNAPGVFTDPDLQGLYDALIAEGEDSPAAALGVGAWIEEYDILDLIEKAEAADDQAVIDTYDRLEAGSENHLRAFVNGLAGQGVTYEPELLTQAAYDAIIAGGGGGGPGGGR